MIFILICTSFAVVLMLTHFVRRTSKGPLAPGPPGLPFIGNILNIPKEYEYKAFKEWSSTYGNVMHLSAAGTHLLVLDSLDSAQDLMEKRQGIYSNRPHSTMLSDVIGWGWSVTLLNPGWKFTKYRQIFHQGLSMSQDQFSQIQKEESQTLVDRLTESPDDFLMHISKWTKRTILRVTYGYIPKSDSDCYIELSDLCVEAIIRAGQPGAYLVDVIPFLRWIPSWIPGAQFQKEGKKWRKLVEEVLENPMNYALSQLDDEGYEACYVSNLLKETNADVRAVKETAAIVHTAGADSLFSVIQSFVLAMVLFPDVQNKAREEINFLVGNGNFPPFSERHRLPYTSKVFLETLRWARVAPLGIAHQAMCDDSYRGMYIPKGTVVMANVWSISTNKELYPSPDQFKPERFDDPRTPDPHLYAFGFGKRVCAGKDYAEKMLWLSIGTILSHFFILKSRDSQGNEITPAVEYTPGLICYPKPFPCSFVKIDTRNEGI